MIIQFARFTAMLILAGIVDGMAVKLSLAGDDGYHSDFPSRVTQHFAHRQHLPLHRRA